MKVSVAKIKQHNFSQLFIFNNLLNYKKLYVAHENTIYGFCKIFIIDFIDLYFVVSLERNNLYVCLKIKTNVSGINIAPTCL